MSVSHIGNDPFVVTEAAGDKLYGEIHPVLSQLGTQTWPELQAKVSELEREVNSATVQLQRFQEDAAANPQLRADFAVAAEKSRTQNRAPIDRLHGSVQALVDVLRAEVVTKAQPKCAAEREQFVRQDLKALLDDSPDALRSMLDIAAGSHRDRAAVVVSDFADAHLQRLLPDRRQREQFREGLSASLLEGSIKHGTESERAAAAAAKTILPRVSAWTAARYVPALARLRSAEELRP